MKKYLIFILPPGKPLKKSLAFYESRPDLFKAISDSLRSDERKALEYQAEKKPEPDTTLRKIKLNKKLIEKKP